MKSGDRVEFHGLKGAAHLNGRNGRLTNFNEQEQRWGVRCDGGGKVVQAKPGNLQLATRRGQYTHNDVGNFQTVFNG